MPEYLFGVGEIDFKIISDFRIINFDKILFNNFIKKTSKSDISFEYIGIESENLKPSPLTANETLIISDFLFPPNIGRGMIVIPPLVRQDEDLSDWVSMSNSRFDVPLFQSELVKSRILSLAARKNKIVLVIHLLSVAIFDFDESKVHIYYIRERLDLFNNEILENSIRRLFTVFLPDFDRVMLHCSGIVRKDRALLFFAPDEGGKTTAIKNAAKGTFLSDDRNILHSNNNKVIAYNTPWGTINAAPINAEVGGMFLLKKSEKFKLVPIKTSEMFRFIWDEHIHNWNFLPNFSRTKAFNILYDICCKVPVYEMSFPINFIDWDVIDRATSNS